MIGNDVLASYRSRLIPLIADQAGTIVDVFEDLFR